MKELLLSLLIWLILPALLIVATVLMNGNVLFLILEIAWLGFGAFLISLAPS